MAKSLNIFKGSAFIFLAILCGRLSGLVREVFLLGTVGPTRALDRFIQLQSVVDWLNGLLIAGTYASLFLPLFARIDRHEIQAASTLNDYVNVFLNLNFLLVSIIFLGVWFSELQHGVYHTQALATATAIGLTFVVTTLPAYFQCILQHRNRLFLAYLGNTLCNVGIVLASILLPPLVGQRNALYLALLFGTCISGSFLVAVGYRQGRAFLPTKPSLGLGSMRGKGPIIKKWLTVLLGMSALTFSLGVDRIMPSSSGEGYISLINMAQKLLLAPLAVLLTSASVFTLKAAAEGGGALAPRRLKALGAGGFFIGMLTAALAFTLLWQVGGARLVSFARWLLGDHIQLQSYLAAMPFLLVYSSLIASETVITILVQAFLAANRLATVNLIIVTAVGLKFALQMWLQSLAGNASLYGAGAWGPITTVLLSLAMLASLTIAYARTVPESPEPHELASGLETQDSRSVLTAP